MWLSHPTFPEVVRDAWSSTTYLSNAISSFTNKTRIWNMDRFGNIFHKKKRICTRLNEIQTALANNLNSFLINLEKSLLTELEIVSNLEAEFWSMKSRISWVVEGDRNTAFFHTSTLIRRQRNHTSSMKDHMGNWLNGEHDITNFIR